MKQDLVLPTINGSHEALSEISDVEYALEDTEKPVSPDSAKDSPVTLGTPKRDPEEEENPQDRRAVHNAIERARRESLNFRLMTLAEALPSMSHVKRASKSAIVNKALDFVYEAQSKEKALVAENQRLRDENETLRRLLNQSNTRAPEPLQQPFEQLQQPFQQPFQQPLQTHQSLPGQAIPGMNLEQAFGIAHSSASVSHQPQSDSYSFPPQGLLSNSGQSSSSPEQALDALVCMLTGKGLNHTPHYMSSPPAFSAQSQVQNMYQGSNWNYNNM